MGRRNLLANTNQLVTGCAPVDLCLLPDFLWERREKKGREKERKKEIGRKKRATKKNKLKGMCKNTHTKREREKGKDREREIQLERKLRKEGN